MVYVSGACCLGEAHLKRIERSYQTIFQVSFIITTAEENSKQNFSPSRHYCPSPEQQQVTFMLQKKNRFSAVKFSEITLEMVFEF
jgi:hypothetical protein